jgi:hypothetical protein
VRDSRGLASGQEIEIYVEKIQQDKGLGVVVISEVVARHHITRQHQLKVHHVEPRAPVTMSIESLTRCTCGCLCL